MAERSPGGAADASERELAIVRYVASGSWFWTSAALGSVPLAIFLLAAVPSFGWIPFAMIGLLGLLGSLGPLRGEKVLSERMYSIGHLGYLIGIGMCAMLTGGATSFLLALLPPLALGFFSRLHPNVATAYALVAQVLACVPVLLLDWDGVLAFPWVLGASVVGMVSLTLVARQMAAGELRNQGEASIDPLTGLLNRRGLRVRLDELVQQAAVLGDDVPMAVVACDLDRFKLVNDTYGHGRGDEVLRDVASLIRAQLRRFELAYRMGGEEFLVLLPGHDRVTAYGLAEAIRSAVERGRPGGVHMTISIGVASCIASSVDSDELLLAADTALLSAKRAGRNRVLLAAASCDETRPVRVQSGTAALS